MATRIEFAPRPVQFVCDFTPDQMARLDLRFAHVDELARRGTLGLVAGDSAALLDAHLTVRHAGAELRVAPDTAQSLIDPNAPSWLGASEAELAWLLGFDLVGGSSVQLDPDVFTSRLASWREGVVYALRRRTPIGAPVVTRRLNLSCFMDWMELEFLVREEFHEMDVIVAYHLGDHGTLRVLRTTPTGGGAVWPTPPLAWVGTRSFRV